MADYYTHFSFTINDLTDDEREWLEENVVAYLKDPEGFGEPAFSVDTVECVGFEVELRDTELWVHSDESGEPEDAAAMVAAFLSRFRPDTTFGFEWSYDCSKPRTDAYGGGAAYITAIEIRYFNTANWLDEQGKV